MVNRNYEKGAKLLRATFSPLEAANFLNVGAMELRILTRAGHLTLRRHNKCDFYLGGELDSIRNDVTTLLRQIRENASSLMGTV